MTVGKHGSLSEDKEKVLEDTFTELGVTPNDFFRFLDTDEIQLDGSFSLVEMQVLAEAMSRMQDKSLKLAGRDCVVEFDGVNLVTREGAG